ncbi:MAG: LD-carboxypeptidase [Candidatus Margulisbacteria bacterium]|nr:LD-carboxypeptidase [Candidatus Margulisiibacteriota bacterium]MBU1022151.1 LD-carboxypeptidase [Candidatus Margulisiibacteriota bacterium]MBU1729410.1 LD-carboxypeptidase [Candidatus Margulisiibacteriota bacterium]MBU1768016.1 LD-carboxypeptidase [Candidatus Omnitrophota bacterium]MBU1955683.1 LD-carboxypeptidase [Candidatus Margulisiibacteriota bacterium]
MVRLSELFLTKPKRLRRGDTIGIVAPAWSFDRDRFMKGVAQLKRLGFKVKYDRSIFSRHWSMAGHDDARAEQINRMFADKEVKAIFCAKAGYGSIRTIPFLDQKIISRNPKIFVGYSDITVLLESLQRIANMVVFHGPVVAGEIHKNMSSITLEYLLRTLMQARPAGEVSFPNLKTLRSGRATGILIGGNMSMLVSGIGTPYDIDTDYKILFLEDIDEDLEVIDNILLHLKLAGKFKRVKGLIFGRMVDCRDLSGRKHKIRDIVDDILGDLDIPMVYGFPSGHARGRGANVTLPLGVSVTLDADAPSLIFNEAGVR